ncbi:MAG: AmmeMemoRadiSam system protein B [Gammaproteobacteria bacterium]
MSTVREPAVAGLFYPDDPEELRTMVNGLLAAARTEEPAPKALVVPHAGYVYSGPIAASGYARLAGVRSTIRRVVLLGPAHRVGFRGLAATTADFFVTPLGSIPVDRPAVDDILSLPQVHALDEAHAQEHSLEVHLPFLQACLQDFTLVPLVVGDASAEEVDEVLERLWGGPETLIVISSDLSLDHDDETARRLDTATSHAIEALRPEDIHYEQACGRNPVGGLLVAARKHGLHGKTIDLRNSGDTAGGRDQVVGYGAYVFN